jgi:hypothetical protein
MSKPYDIFTFLKDFDDDSLPFEEWRELMAAAVRVYNDLHSTLHDPANIIQRYLHYAKQ